MATYETSISVVGFLFQYGDFPAYDMDLPALPLGIIQSSGYFKIKSYTEDICSAVS